MYYSTSINAIWNLTFVKISAKFIQTCAFWDNDGKYLCEPI
jgi:hypothetical protein